ncbi:MAG TPA: hypothetical protein VGN34_34515 [Ktedonobacteraceae bacterium]|jgi:adenylate kinase family enzyme
MVKIYILGGSGSGKTTLAENLSSRLSIPHHDLDKNGWKNGNQWAAYVYDAIAIAEQPGWIAEGNYIIWTDPLFYQADYIVWLEISWPLAAWRILSRHILKSLRGINPYPGVKALFTLLKDTRTYYLEKVHSDPSVTESVRQYLEEHGADTALADVETLIIRWERCVKEIPFTADFVRMYLEKYQEKVLLIKNHADRERLLELLTNR